MRKIELTRSFKRDYKKVLSNPRHRDVAFLLDPMMEKLADDQMLEPRFRDHLLTGDYKNHRSATLSPICC